MKGTPLTINPNDIMTIPDQNGIKWVTVESEKITKSIQVIQRKLLKTHFDVKTIHSIDFRNVDDTRFNSPTSFHFINENEAIEFKRLIEKAK